MCVKELAIMVTQRLTEDKRPTTRFDDTESPVPIRFLKKLIFLYLKVHLPIKLVMCF